MPAFNIFKLRNPFEGHDVADFDDYLANGRSPNPHQSIEIPGGEAKLYIWSSFPRPPKWASFIRDGFGDEVDIPNRAATGALVIVRIELDSRHHYFGLPFGPTGRFILNQSAIERAYGLRSALNIIYPRSLGDTEQDAARLVSLDSKRRQRDLMRARVQTARASTFETFDIDQLRDLVDAATGRPADTTGWGHRMTGADGLSFSIDIPFSELAQLCKRVELAHRQNDYRARFTWLDDVQPVTDPVLVSRLEHDLVDRIRNGQIDEIDLAPPQIVNWEDADLFRFHTDGHRRVHHRQLRLRDYVSSLRNSKVIDDLTFPYLTKGTVRVVDGDGGLVHQWHISNCLVGTLDVDGTTYVIDEGQFFTIAKDFIDEIDTFLDALDSGATVLPECAVGVHEREYNQSASTSIGCLLLDRKNLVIPTRTTSIELCDLLTSDKELIHVKRELGSRDLSHLFSQGTTSAELIHDNEEFRVLVQEKVHELAGDDAYAFFDKTGIRTSEFRVVFGVIADWRNRKPSEALPFFSKLNLRRTVRDLTRRGFRVGFQRVKQAL